MTQWLPRGGLVLVGTLLLAGGVTLGQDQKPSAQPDKLDPMMAAWMKAATPGPEHQRLKILAGHWTGAVKMWMEPGKPPVESTCTAERKWILGGRFLQDDVKGQFLGQPFGGMGLTGYDNLQKKYTAIWVDTLSTAISTSLGTADSSGKIVTWVREEIDPLTGKKFKGRDVVHLTSADQNSVEMFKEGPDGKELKVMEIVFTRQAKRADQ